MASRPLKRGGNVWAITKRDFYEINFKWTIEGFSLYPDETGETIKSPLFGGDGKNKFWRLNLYPGGYNEENNGHISLFIENSSSNDITVDYRIGFQGSKGNFISHFIKTLKF